MILENITIPHAMRTDYATIRKKALCHTGQRTFSAYHSKVSILLIPAAAKIRL